MTIIPSFKKQKVTSASIFCNARKYSYVCLAFVCISLVHVSRCTSESLTTRSPFGKIFEGPTSLSKFNSSVIKNNSKNSEGSQKQMEGIRDKQKEADRDEQERDWARRQWIEQQHNQMIEDEIETLAKNESETFWWFIKAVAGVFLVGFFILTCVLVSRSTRDRIPAHFDVDDDGLSCSSPAHNNSRMLVLGKQCAGSTGELEQAGSQKYAEGDDITKRNSKGKIPGPSW